MKEQRNYDVILLPGERIAERELSLREAAAWIAMFNRVMGSGPGHAPARVRAVIAAGDPSSPEAPNAQEKSTGVAPLPDRGGRRACRAESLTRRCEAPSSRKEQARRACAAAAC